MQYDMSNAYSELIDVTKDRTYTSKISSCRECGHDRSFRLSLDDVGSSIDIFPLLIWRTDLRISETEQDTVHAQTSQMGARLRGV